MSAQERKGRPDAERLRQIEAVYHDARERAASERALFLVTTCGDDADLAQEVASLLELEEDEGLFERPVLDLAAPLLEGPLESDLVPGALVGPYEIVGRVGAGGMGEVFRAQDTRLGRRVALKVVHERFSGHSLLEARATAALNHPHICTLYDVGPNYLVLELLEGETLAERLRRGALSRQEVLTYGAQIADALHCAHSHGVTHGDLKPQNLMLTKGGVKVLDFGLARVAAREQAGEGTEPGAPTAPRALGTPAYLSPEQVGGGPGGPPADIFALGVVLFEMATGSRPFSGGSREELAEAIEKADPAVGRLAPPEFAHIVDRCLAKAPEDRWQTARDVKLELDYVARALPKPAMVATVRRHRWLVAAAASLAALALATFYFRRTPPDVTITPFTSYPGGEDSPSFSPDGNQLVFSWNGPREDNRDIYIKQIGPGNPVRLTTDPAEDIMPRWSPDGKWIAFLRRTPSRGMDVYLIPALGGMERKLRGDTQPSQKMPCLDWSPDGQWLVVSAPLDGGKIGGLVLLSVDTGETRPFSNPAASQFDHAPRFAPDGSAMAYQREGVGLMMQSLGPRWNPTGLPRKVPVDVTGPIRSISWTRDSQDLILAVGFGESPGLWRVPASGNAAAQRLPFGEAGIDADVARQGNRMAFSRSDRETNIWSLDIDGGGRAIGRAARVFDSTRSELSPSFSPDGSRVAFGSNRSGNDEIWTCVIEASDCAQVTSMNGSHAGSPSWSPDGNWIAFDVSYPDTWEVHLVRSSGGKSKRLASGMLPRWSRDGKWIYYQCSFAGPSCRVSASGGNPVRVGDGGMPQESPDGQWLYSVRRQAGNGFHDLLRKSLTDGTSREQKLPLVLGRDFVVMARGIWYLAPGGAEGAVLSYYDLALGSSRAVYQTTRAANAGLTVSPDGRRVLFTQADRGPNVDLILAEGFR